MTAWHGNKTAPVKARSREIGVQMQRLLGLGGTMVGAAASPGLKFDPGREAVQGGKPARFAATVAALGPAASVSIPAMDRVEHVR